MILICIILFLPVASADTISEILETKYLDFAHALNYSGIYDPDKTVQQSGHIRGWIDIVGYDNMAMIDGVYYIPGAPEDYAIVKHKLWDTGLYWNNNLDYIKITDERIFQDGDNITAEIDIHLKWHHSTLKCRGIPPSCRIHKKYHDEYVTFRYNEIAPKTFISSDYSNVSVDVVIYNNSVSPKTTLKVINVPENTISINYTYDNESIIHHKGIATQEYTDKNCPYMQINSTDIWEDDGNLSQFNEFAIIPSMNYSTDNLTVTVNDPYEAHIVDNVTIYEVKWHGMKDTFSSLLLLFVAIIGIFILGVIIQLRRI
ncbi:MAG: hypothetical protein KAJ93_02590 [Methanosarcinales archaeon]|nr:hypothetical protein [Methanosarcinales archaeon]